MYRGSSSTPTSSENFLNFTMSESSPVAGVSYGNTVIGKVLEYWSMFFYFLFGQVFSDSFIL